MITKNYEQVLYGQNAKITAEMTEEEQSTTLSMAKRYGWAECDAVMVLRGIRDKTLWDRVKITYTS